MQRRIYISAAGAVLCAVASFDGGLIVQAKDTKGGASAHASLRAYPEAVVSVTDPASGITVSVDPNGTALTARSKSGGVLWRADVLQETGKPSVGFPVVRRLDATDRGAVSVVVGKHRFVEADLNSGKLKFLGED